MTGRRLQWVVVAMVAAVGCVVKPAPRHTRPPGGNNGTVTAPAITAAMLAQRYQECWGFFNTRDWANFQSCYTLDAESDSIDSGSPPVKGWDSVLAAHTKPIVEAMPDAKGTVELTLINGLQGVTIVLFTGHHTGVLKTPMGDIPPTQLMVGQQVAHQVRFAPSGKSVLQQKFYQDIGVMMSQLGLSPTPGRALSTDAWPVQTVVAQGDATEKRNLGTVVAFTEAFNQHVAPTMASYLADDLVWSETGVPVDWDKQRALAGQQDLFNGFSDLRISPTTTWAAGDYVVMQGTFAGTNDGVLAAMGINQPTNKQLSLGFLQLYKLDAAGKITRSWGFWNSAAFALQLGLGGPTSPPSPG